MFRSSRQRRIDRALSAVLQSIDDDHNRLRESTKTWTQLDWLAITMDRQRIRAHDRAQTLRNRWQARVKELDS